MGNSAGDQTTTQALSPAQEDGTGSEDGQTAIEEPSQGEEETTNTTNGETAALQRSPTQENTPRVERSTMAIQNLLNNHDQVSSSQESQFYHQRNW
jgi:hypothetical protein